MFLVRSTTICFVSFFVSFVFLRLAWNCRPESPDSKIGMSSLLTHSQVSLCVSVDLLCSSTRMISFFFMQYTRSTVYMAGIKIAWLRDGVVTEGKRMYCKCHFCVVHFTYTIMLNRISVSFPSSIPEWALLSQPNHIHHSKSSHSHFRPRFPWACISIINVLFCSTYHAFEYTFLSWAT